MSTLRIGLLGAGRIGQVHASTISYRVPSAQLVAVADINEAAAKACAEKYRIPQVDSDPLKIINNPEIDAVLICSVTDTHTPLIKAAAAAGKHIFCEKPVAMTVP